MAREMATAVALAGILAALTPQQCPGEQTVEFLRDVKPIFAQRCFRCHSSLEQESSLRLDSVPAIQKGGERGPAIVPGKSDESRLIAAVERRGELKMPPEGEPLSQQEIAVLRAWIDAGALPSPDGSESKSRHWAFQKPVRPPVPQIIDRQWAGNSIDAFIAAKHAELKLTPVGLAPPNVLLRRVYLDLIGLPPTPKQLEDFLAIVSSPPPPLPLAHSFPSEVKSGREEEWEKHYGKFVDELLASPQYGERWGRHWMDVWRYSDWDGYKDEVRESKPHIWRWRDWIVESLNADKPYGRMVQEMLAADEIAPEDPDALRATGYLVRSWYKFNRNKWLDDAIEHTGKAFLGVTFNCCRCHDHMYDPLSQRDYYALRAFFEPYDVRTDRLPGEANIDKAGLVRVFDASLDAQTFVFARGNDKNPLKDNPVSPAVPSVFSAAPWSIEPVAFPRTASYPGLASFVRDETLAAARSEVEKATDAVASAEKKLAEALKKPLAESSSSEARPPAPDPALSDADAQLALAKASLTAAGASLAFTQIRLAADEAAYSAPPAASAKELALAAASIERRLNVQQSEKALFQAEINLTAARRAKKDGDAKTTAAFNNAETAVANAIKARGEAIAALDKPLGDYTHFTPTYPTTSTGRRSALARWITSPENPLAARVAINHIWLRHFGAPLVPTVFDFGVNGKPPTNQPLLDWLAVELMENGWRMKHIHRLIIMSRTYQLASTARLNNDQTPRTEKIQNCAAIDPENIYLWRANPRRMEAEVVRDATLAVAGSLDLTCGGPDLDPNQGLTVPRRSLYFRAAKEKKVQFLSLFDSANPVECYRRSESIAPQQALAMANSTLTLAQARILAKKLIDALVSASPEHASRRFVEAAFLRILCRPPSSEELEACLEFLADEARALTEPKALTAFASGPAPLVGPASDSHQRARENLVHVLLNHNDFVTIR